MENKIKEIAKDELAVIEQKKITRKEAIKKTGLIAVSAATMMILLGTPKQAMASPTSAPAPPPQKSSGNGNSPWK